MKQRTLFRYFTLICVALSGAAVVSALISSRINSIGNLSVLPPPLQKYISEDQQLSLYYPSNWVYHFDNSTDEAGETTHTLTLNPRDEAQKFFTVSVGWSDYFSSADCATFAKEQEQQSLDVHNAKITDPIGQSIHALFTTLHTTVIAGYPACQFPVSTAYAKNIAYREEMFAILRRGKVYSISFPAADSPTSIILDPAKNNRIAHRILDSLQILDEAGGATNNPSSTTEIPVTHQRSNGSSVLTIPYFHATLTIPETFVTAAEVKNGVDRQSANYTDLACGTLALTTLGKNTLWLQYRDDQDPLCGTEIGFPLSLSIEYDMNGAAQPCDGLQRNLNYAHCKPLTLSKGTSTVMAATWYQFIPDYYGTTNEGTLTYVIALHRPRASHNRMLLLALAPEKLSTTPKTFQRDAEALALGSVAAQNNFIKESTTLLTIAKTAGISE